MQGRIKVSGLLEVSHPQSASVPGSEVRCGLSAQVAADKEPGAGQRSLDSGGGREGKDQGLGVVWEQQGAGLLVFSPDCSW